MIRIIILSLFGLLFAAASALAVTIPTVPVGNPGNDGRARQFGGPIGAVAYDYRIGTTEVTNAQYAEFLNAKATSDPFDLYNDSMGSDAYGGIIRSGSNGGYAYDTKQNMGNKPVNFVNWFDAMRFINWLNNGQGDGDTETGAYTLLGGGPTQSIPSNHLTVSRNAGAIWFLPTQDEWFKAGYYDPTLNSGAGGYWTYPTRSDSVPMQTTVTSEWDIANPGANVANYRGTNPTTVGSAGPLSESFYGTSDQGGNVWEWTETRDTTPPALGQVFVRGSAFNNASSASMLAEDKRSQTLIDQLSGFGFRVATVPEPSTYALGAFALVALLLSRRLKRS